MRLFVREVCGWKKGYHEDEEGWTTYSLLNMVRSRSMITQVTIIWSTRFITLVCTLRVGFSPSWRVSGSEREILGTSKPFAIAGEGRDEGVAERTVVEGVGERMTGGVGGGVGNELVDDMEGFEEARRPDTRFPEAHSKSSALPPGQPAFHLYVRPSEVANILDWPL